MELDHSTLAHTTRAFGSAWLSQARSFATSLRGASNRPGGLLVVGTPSHEPWHLVAHLDQQARRSGHAGLSPTLVRYHVPANAAPHLRIDLRRLQAVTAQETVLVIAPDLAPQGLLERVNDARRTGATILLIDADDPELRDLAHHALTVDDSATLPSAAAFDTAQHLVSALAGRRPNRWHRYPKRENTETDRSTMESKPRQRS